MPKPWANLQMTFAQLEKLPLKRGFFFFFCSSKTGGKRLLCLFIVDALSGGLVSSKIHFNNHLRLQTVNELSRNEESCSLCSRCYFEKYVLKLQRGWEGVGYRTGASVLPPPPPHLQHAKKHSKASVLAVSSAECRFCRSLSTTEG